MLLKKLIAYFLLGLRAVFLHPLKMLFTPEEERGKQRFLKNYAPDGLVPYSVEERAQLPRFGGCINCGLCDAVCPLVPSGFRGPSLVALAWSRSTPELRSLRTEIASLDSCGTCSKCQQSCPRGVPLLDIFAFTKHKLAQVDASLTRPL